MLICRLFFCLFQILSTLQRPFKNLPPTGKAIPPPKISDSQYQSKAQLQAVQAKQPATIANTSSIPTNGVSTFTAAHPANMEKLKAPSSPPLPPPPEQAQNPASMPSDYAVTEL